VEFVALLLALVATALFIAEWLRSRLNMVALGLAFLTVYLIIVHWAPLALDLD
jgi:hypothetical protein